MKRAATLFATLLATATALADVTAIRAGTLVDPAKGTALTNQTILIEDGVIKAIGPTLTIPMGARIVDLSHEWVTAGLIDAHTHLALTMQPGNAAFEAMFLKESATYRALRAAHHGEALLHQGFTTIRDLGNGADYVMMDVRRGIANGWFAGPTILTTGKIITPFGGQSNKIPAEQGSFWKYEYIDADTPDEIRKAVRVNIYYGADVIKMALDNQSYHYSVQELKAGVDEAHHAGVPVAVHVYGGEALDNAIEAGVDSIEHGFDLTDAQMRKMKDKGIFLVGTDMPFAHLDFSGSAGGIFPDPPDVMAKKIVDRLTRAHKIGVRMAFGSDTAIEMPGRTRADQMLDYLAVWRQANIPAMEVLKDWTAEPAALLGLSNSRGRLAPGLQADIIAMPADPIRDLENLRKVDFVMKDGVIVRFDGGPQASH